MMVSTTNNNRLTHLIFIVLCLSAQWRTSAFASPGRFAQSSQKQTLSQTVSDVNDVATNITILSKTKVGGPDGGFYHRIKHASTSTKTEMTFGLYLPHSYDDNTGASPTPAIFWLSGLTCDDTNFAQKAGGNAFTAANRENVALVIPDTSPRGLGVHDVDNYDLGVGAGFYVDASEEPYSEHYNMRSYITKELPDLLVKNFNIGVKSISGQSMG